MGSSKVSRTEHLGLGHGQHYADNVQNCVAHHNEGLRLNHGHDDGHREQDGECQQQLAIIPIGAHKANDQDDQLDDEQHDEIGVVPVSLQLGQQVHDDHDQPVDGRCMFGDESRSDGGLIIVVVSDTRRVAVRQNLPKGQDDHESIFDRRVETHFDLVFLILVQSCSQ